MRWRSKARQADPSRRVGFMQFLIDWSEVFTEIVQANYDETNEQFGTDERRSFAFCFSPLIAGR